MTFAEWTETVPRELKDDPLWRMEGYRLSLFAADLAWPDEDPRQVMAEAPDAEAVSAGGRVAEPAEHAGTGR